MKQLKNLKFDVVETQENHGITQRVTINRISPGGFVRHIQLTNSHIVVRRANKIVSISLDDLVAAAESVEPDLIPPPPKPQPESAHN